MTRGGTIEVPEIKTILLDMDGVCCDFVTAAAEANGQDVDHIMQQWTAGGGWNFYELWGATESEFWRPIDGRPEFWNNLKPTPWYDGLIDLLDGFEWMFASSPSHCPSSQAGKAAWISSRGYDASYKAMLGSRKDLLARPGTVLIDDSPKKCKAFVDAGGQAVLFPAHWNSQHQHKANPLPYVRDQLSKIRAAESVDRQEFGTGAVRSSDANQTRYDLISHIGLRRLAEAYAEGAEKYDDNNWLKGFPASDVMNHCLRHVYLWLSGDTTEDHLSHAAWNLFSVMHFEEVKPELIDCYHRNGEHDQ